MSGSGCPLGMVGIRRLLVPFGLSAVFGPLEAHYVITPLQISRFQHVVNFGVDLVICTAAGIDLRRIG